MILDTHQHFWQLSRGDYPWPDDSVAPIFRDFMPADLSPHLKRNGVSKTIVVQATDTIAETEFLLDLAAGENFIAGVVGWVPLDAPDVAATLERLRKQPYLLGVRPMLQNIDDSNWILRDDVQPAIAHLQATGLRLDALIQPRHLGAIMRVAEAYPDLKIVIDHIAKPVMGIDPTPDAPWRAGMASLATCPNVYCKLSGMLTEIGPDWSQGGIAQFGAHVLACFGPDKIMWGSDWPVVNLAAEYDAWCQTAQDLTKHLSPEEKHSIFWATGHRFYGLS